MAMTIFFSRVAGGIEMLARAEGPGAVGDSREVLSPGDKLQWPKGLTYAALDKAGGGQLHVADDGSWKIEPAAA